MRTQNHDRPIALTVALLSYLVAGSCLAQEASAAPIALEKPPDFERDVRPLLKHRCVKCHGSLKQAGKLNLSVPAGVARGGERGAVIVPGQPAESLLWQMVEQDEMPEGTPLSADEKQLLKRWIEAGAPGLPRTGAPSLAEDLHWAFQKLKRPPIPEVKQPSTIRTALDAHIVVGLEAVGLTLSPEANRETLIRRVALDLTGLPPTIDEIDAFLNDAEPQAYERMVERYLASPRYGERWGKHWLDAAGYADSNGYFSADTDRPLAYRYRDYVIRSINADKPFDRFVREQLCGDEMSGFRPGEPVTPEVIDLLEATHFLRTAHQYKRR